MKKEAQKKRIKISNFSQMLLEVSLGWHRGRERETMTSLWHLLLSRELLLHSVVSQDL